MSFMDYKGNKSTSLMARDLLTPDEVKQLHYKTIIFPIIGYPIFRDTVMYDKFSCYSKGEVSREVNSLKNLDYTYFTVEQIKAVNRRFRNRENNELDKEERNFYKEQRELEEKVLLQAVEQVQNVVKEEELNYDYKEVNHRTYSVVNVDRPLTTIEKTQITARVDSEFFHVEISDNQEGKSVIEIHLKNPVNLDVDLEKGSSK